jgi:hypothetical protein
MIFHGGVAAFDAELGERNRVTDLAGHHHRIHRIGLQLRLRAR